MTTYRSDLQRKTIRHGTECIVGHYDREHAHTIEVLNPKDAARVFAYRVARRTFGKRGYCHHVRQDSYLENGRWFLYEAFIGVPAEGGGTSGHNIRFSVSVDE